MSVRLRVTLAATVTVGIVLTITGWLLVAQQRRTLTEGVDDSIEARVISLASAASAGASADELVLAGDDDQWAVVTDDTGLVLAFESRTPAELQDRGPQLDPVTPRTEDDGDPNVMLSDLHSSSGRSWRLASLRVVIEGAAAQLHVAGSLSDVDEATGSLRDSLVLGVPLVGAALAALIWVLTGRTLAPVDEIRSTVDAMDGSELSARVPVPSTGDEVGRLASTMNAMLDRLEESSNRQRRFVGDAAHELRSPMARMRAHLDVDEPDRDRLLRDVDALQRLVDDLLELARRDERRPLRLALVDLDDVVLRAITDLRGRLGGLGSVVIDTGGISAAQVRGDADALRRVVDNLLDNACRHASSRVVVTVAEHPDAAVVSVADDGPGIPAAERERVFDRFARLDEARSHGQGTGLGLAIVREVIDAHDGAVTIDADHSPGTRMIVRLPLP